MYVEYLQANSRLEELSEKIKWFEEKEKYAEVFFSFLFLWLEIFIDEKLNKYYQVIKYFVIGKCSVIKARTDQVDNFGKYTYTKTSGRKSAARKKMRIKKLMKRKRDRKPKRDGETYLFVY